MRARRIVFYLIAIFLGYFLGGIVNCFQREYNNKTTIENMRRMSK